LHAFLGFKPHPGPSQRLAGPHIGNAVDDHRTTVTQADAATHPANFITPGRPVGRPYTGCHQNRSDGFAFISRDLFAVDFNFKNTAPIYIFPDSQVCHSIISIAFNFICAHGSN
jgi:hypothetical protein